MFELPEPLNLIPAQPTPGPWRAAEYKQAQTMTPGYWVRCADIIPVCTLNHDPFRSAEEQAANARLIAAAPALLDALKACQHVLAALTDPKNQHVSVVTVYADCLRAELGARQAIAAARGEATR